MHFRCTLQSAVLLASMLSLSAFPASAQTAKPSDLSSFRVGLKSVTIPSPSSDVAETGPDYRVLLDQIVPTGNRLVAGYVTPDEFTNLRTKSLVALSHYALVEAPRSAEFSDITPDAFKQIDATLATQFEVVVNDSVKEQQDEMNRRLKALGAGKSLSLDKPLMLGTLFSKADASSYGQITPVTLDGATKEMAVGITLLRVRQRLLFLYFCEEYKDENTVKQLRATSERWADATLEANQ
jgi:hypothetical protein